MKRTSKKNTPKVEAKKKLVLSQNKKQPFFKENLKYLFLILILFAIFVDLYFAYQNIVPEKSKFLLKIKKLLILPTIIIGIISIYFNKQKLTELVDRLFNTKRKQKNTFRESFKNVFSKKEIITTSSFILILGISIFTLFYKLGNFDIYSDEVSVIRGATSYYHTGEFKYWDFVKNASTDVNYNRAKPHQFVVAQSYKVFGISEWSARFPSAIFGVIFIVLLFFIGNFFVRDKTAVLLTIFSFAFYFDFLALGRWARMYAMIFPFFLLSFYFLYKFIAEKGKIKATNFKDNKIFNNYLNFNYIYLLPLLILIVLNLKNHQNTTVLFPVFLLFSLVLVLVFKKEKKYITASIIAIAILVYQIVNPYKVSFSRFTFFEIEHAEHYAKILFGYPFSEYLSVIFIAIGVFALFLVKNNSFIKKYLLMFILAGLTFVMFSYVFDYASHYRYVSFIAPLTVLLILGTFALTTKTLFNKYINVFLIFTLVASVSLKFSNDYDKLYVKNAISPAKPSIAHKTIVKNHKKEEVIFRHYGPKMYLKGIDKNTKFIDKKKKKKKSFYEIFEQIKQYKSGWIIWHSYNAWNIDKSLINYANLYFKKYNGYGIDNTGEEVFYYTEKMIRPSKEFKSFENFPVANLKLNNSYSFVFEMKIDSLTNGNIFTLKNDSINKIICKIENEKLIISIGQNLNIQTQIPVNKKNTIVFFEDVKKETTSYGIILNGKQVANKQIKTEIDLVKFKLNPYFNGYVDKIRLYDFVLNSIQIEEIKKNTDCSQILTANKEDFTALYLWQKNKKNI